MKRIFVSTVYLIVLFSPLAFCPLVDAQIDSLNIDGPLEARPGQLVQLRAEITESETPFWIVLNPIDLQYEQVENGRRLIFATGCQPSSSVVVMLSLIHISEPTRPY